MQFFDLRDCIVFVDVHLDRDFRFDVSSCELVEIYVVVDPDNMELYEVDG